MAKLTLKELQNLSNLLLSPEEQNVLLGLALLENHPESVPVVHKALVLIWQLNDHYPHSQAALTWLRTQYTPKELDQWQKAFELFTSIPRIYEYSLKVHRLLQAHENVRQDYQDLILQNHKYCLAYYQVGNQLERYLKKHLDLAETYYRIVLSSNPNHQSTLFRLAFMLDQHKNSRQESLSYYLRIEQIDPKDSAVINNIGCIHEQEKQFKLAYDYYKKAHQMLPNSNLYLRNLAKLCARRLGEEYKSEAKTLLKRLIDQDPETGNNWNTWADYLWNTEHDYEAAEAAYLKGLKVDPKNAWLLGNLGEFYIDVRQEYDKGLDLYIRSLEQSESIYRFTTMVSLLVLHYKDFAQAKSYYQRLLAMVEDKEIPRDRDLTDRQWNDFIQAQQQLLQTIKK